MADMLSARRGSLNRWLFQGEVEEERQENPCDENETYNIPGGNSFAEQDLDVAVVYASCTGVERRASEPTIVASKGTAKGNVGRLSVSSISKATPGRGFMSKPRPPISTTPTQAKEKAPQKDLAKPSPATIRRASLPDPRITWERKLHDAQEKEREARAQVNELNRKIISLEERMKVLRREKAKTATTKKVVEPKDPETYEQTLARDIVALLSHRDLNEELKQNIKDAVLASVTQSLLLAAQPVPPPKRQPPMPLSLN